MNITNMAVIWSKLNLIIEFSFIFIRVGDMGVGKSCLLHQFTEKKCE